jgi:hypothetical protein
MISTILFLLFAERHQQYKAAPDAARSVQRRSITWLNTVWPHDVNTNTPKMFTELEMVF